MYLLENARANKRGANV